MAPPRFQYTITPVDEPHDPWKDAMIVGSHEYSSKAWADSPPQQHTFRTEHDEKSPKTDRFWSWSSLSEKGRTWTWWSKEDDEPKPTPMHANWKPLSMTTPILLSVIVASLLMIAAIEVLAQRSQKEGALALSPSLSEISSYALIASQYVPQLLAVLYSLAWSWIDLDVKRMQPWFELAKPEGALARDSLLLDYPFTFVASVPVIAGRRRHWLVLLSGTVMVLVFWAITPLQSAQLGTGSVIHSSYLEIVNRSELVPVAQQENLLDSEVLNTMYSIAWLEQPYPEFMLQDRAFLPFYPAESSNFTAIPGTNLTATTTELSTELDCWPASEIVQNKRFGRSTYDILSGKGCNASVSMLTSEGFTMFYIGYYSSPYSSYWLGSNVCPETEDNKHQFLATFAKTPDNYTELMSESKDLPQYDITASFCQPHYFKQKVLVTVDANTLKPHPDSVQPLGSRETLADTEFNRTAFEFLLGNGMGEEVKTRDFPYNFVVEQNPKIKGRDLIKPVSNMVGFVVADDDRNTSDYKDHELLQAAYNHAHQHLFSVAVSQLLVNGTDVGNSTATKTSQMSGIVVSRPISAVLEALLGVVVLFTALVLWFSRSAKSSLPFNPSSIDRVADIVRESPQLSDFFCSVGNGDEDSLVKATEGKRFRLVRKDVTVTPEITVDHSVDETAAQDHHAPKGYYVPVKPLFFRIEIGIAFIIGVLGVLGGLGYLKWAEVKFNGLQRPSPNKEVQQILENYIPTILATMIEPFWILINRLLCVLQPFNQLWQGKASPSRSLSATYTSVPPQFALWRSLKSGHILLSIVCSAVFLANVLAISLPAIFNDQVVTARYSESFRPTVSTQLNNQSVHELPGYLINSLATTSQYSDHGYALLSNLSSNTPLLPWTSQDYFFQPFEISRPSKNLTADLYSVRTRGFGIRTNCTAVPAHDVSLDETDEPVSSPNASFCGDTLRIAGGAMFDETYRSSTGVSAVEYLDVPTGGEVVSCDRTVTFGWGRAKKAEDLNATIRASFAVCYPIFDTALFDVEVDASGYVQNYTRTGNLTSTLDYPDSSAHIDALVASSNGIIGDGVTRWHNDSLTRDWINHLVMVKTGSRSNLVPTLDVPDPAKVIPTLDPIFRTLFALLLALNRDYLFEPADEQAAIAGHRLVIQTRLFMDKPAFIISIVFLSINAAIAAFLYSCRTPFVLPRMPTTLGSLIAYIAPSRLLLEDKDSWALGPEKRTFSFGRFIGRDGAAHVGIEADPHVVPIDLTSLGRPPARKTRPLFGKKEDIKPSARSNTWL